MAIMRQVLTSLQRDGTDVLGTRTLALKLADESNCSCVLRSRGAVLDVYETAQCCA